MAYGTKPSWILLPLLMDYRLLLSVPSLLKLREVERFTAKKQASYLWEWRLFLGSFNSKEHSFLTIWQRIATLGIFMIMLLALFWTKAKKPWAVIAVLTAVELTANAAIVQSRVGYTDAYKYHDAVLQLKMPSIQFVLMIWISIVSIRHLT